MSKKKRSRILDYTIYFVVRCLVCLIQMMSWRSAGKVASGLAAIAYYIDKRHRNVAKENLRRSFPGRYSEEEIDRIVRHVYKHFCTVIMEICLIPRKLRIYNYKNYVQLVDEKTMVRSLLSDRPLMIVTCHLGNWELAGYFLGLCGFTTYAVARELDNPYLDDFLRKFRENTGQKILAKKGDYDQMTEVMNTGGNMATLGDQDAGKRGVFVEFFGRPASTHKAIALMAIEYQVPLIVSATIKVGEPLQFKIINEDYIDPVEYVGQPDAVKAITQRFTAAVERLVRRAPEQYFWLHNRWKSQPAQKRKRAA